MLHEALATDDGLLEVLHKAQAADDGFLEVSHRALATDDVLLEVILMIGLWRCLWTMAVALEKGPLQRWQVCEGIDGSMCMGLVEVWLEAMVTDGGLLKDFNTFVCGP